MVGEIFAGLSAFNSLFKALSTLRDVDDAIKRNAAVHDLWKEITAIQTQYTAALEQVGDLKEKLARFENWEGEKARYQLTDYGGGTFAYELKPAMADTEPPHKICANCYQGGRKSILQHWARLGRGQDRFRCQGCQSQVDLGQSAPRGVPTIDRGPGPGGWMR